MSFITKATQNLTWFILEIVRILSTPLGALGGMLDAIRGWRYSRNSLCLWLNFPVFLLVLAVYVTLAFSLVERRDAKIQRYAVTSERSLSTRVLEREAFSQFRFMATDPEQVKRDSQGGSELTEFNLRYADLLARRIISIEPGNALGHYRLALLKSVTGERQLASESMHALANGKYGLFPQANAWVASEMIDAKERGENIDLQALGSYLGIAVDWTDVPVRLLQVYSNLLEQNNYTAEAVNVIKTAAQRVPEMNLELARLYSRLKSEDALRETSYRVEEVFGTRLNEGKDRDVDRLAIAEVRLLTGKHNQAIAILEEGIALSNNTRPQLSRGLSTLYANLFEKSIKLDDNGKLRADMTLLEAAAQADPNDPLISEQITKLLKHGVAPSKNVLRILSKQIEAGVTTASAHNLLAEGFLAKGNEREAIKNWEIALKKSPNDVFACNNLAHAACKKDPPDIPRALELIERASKYAPENEEVLDTYGEVLLKADRPKEAVNKLEKALRINPLRLGTRKRLVEAYEAAGLSEMAKAQQQMLDEATAAQKENNPAPAVKPVVAPEPEVEIKVETPVAAKPAGS